MAKKQESKEEAVVLTPKEILKNFINSESFKDLHYNNVKGVCDYKISTGSLSLDRALSGGLQAGVHRFIGVREGGKTSASLVVAENFIKKHGEKAHVTLYKAEGRLDANLLARYPTLNESNFTVIKSNIYELVVGSMRSLWKANKDNNLGYYYLFIIDSVDGLITKEESDKEIGETPQISSSARLLSTILKKLALALVEYGHMAIFISQERSNIVINQYAPRDQKQGNSSGGNAIQHYANYVLNFLNRNQKDLIRDGEDGPILGHNCKVRILKSTNDNSLTEVEYPIRRKYGVWREREVADVCLESEIFIKENSKSIVLNREDISKELLADLDEKFKARFPERFVGINKYYEFFMDPGNKDIVDYFFTFLSEQIA